MFLFDRPRSSNYKMDTLFFNAVGRAKKTYYKKIGWHVFKLALLVIFLVVDTLILKTEQWKLVILMRLGIAVSVINVLINMIIIGVGYKDNSDNNSFLLYLAEAVGHSAIQQRIQNTADMNILRQCVSSTLYNANNGSNNNDPVLTKQIKQKYETINKNLIEGQILQKHKCLPVLDLIGRILSLAAVIYGVAALFLSHPSLIEVIVLSLYLILQSMNIWMVILVLLGLLFSPLICCFACLYLVCTGGSFLVDRESLSIPEPTKATAQMIQQTDGSCTICLQNFSINDKLIALSCSPKHVFHQNCILSWLRVSKTCPICRKQVPQSI